MEQLIGLGRTPATALSTLNHQLLIYQLIGCHLTNLHRGGVGGLDFCLLMCLLKEDLFPQQSPCSCLEFFRWTFLQYALTQFYCVLPYIHIYIYIFVLSLQSHRR